MGGNILNGQAREERASRSSPARASPAYEMLTKLEIPRLRHPDSPALPHGYATRTDNNIHPPTWRLRSDPSCIVHRASDTTFQQALAPFLPRQPDVQHSLKPRSGVNPPPPRSPMAISSTSGYARMSRPLARLVRGRRGIPINYSCLLGLRRLHCADSPRPHAQRMVSSTHRLVHPLHGAPSLAPSRGTHGTRSRF